MFQEDFKQNNFQRDTELHFGRRRHASWRFNENIVCIFETDSSLSTERGVGPHHYGRYLIMKSLGRDGKLWRGKCHAKAGNDQLMCIPSLMGVLPTQAAD
jgi:hypothetical protein